MSETVILELNQNNADAVYSNGDYHCTFAQPVIVNPGDQIGLKMASIDSQKSEDDTIVIDQDTQISVTFSYYDVDYDKADKWVLDDSALWPDATYDFYAAYSDNTNFYSLEKIKVTIVGYNPPDIRPPPYSKNTSGSMVLDVDHAKSSEREFILNITYIDNNGDTKQAQLTGDNSSYDATTGFWQATGPTFECKLVAGSDPVIFKDGTIKANGYAGEWAGAKSGFLPGTLPPGATEVSPNDVPFKNSQFTFNNKLVTEGGDVTASASPVGGAQLDIQVETVTIPAGSYDPQALAITITQLLNNSQGLEGVVSGQNQRYVPKNKFLTRTDVKGASTMFFRKLDFTGTSPGSGTITFDNTNSYIYSAGGSVKVPYYVGASQFALEYGSAGRIFSLNFAHMPLFNPDEGQKQNVGIYWTGSRAGNDLRYYEIDRSSGIVIHDMTPVDFWTESLGLYEALKVPLYTDANGIKYYYKTDLLNKTTAGYASLNQFLLTTNPAHDAGEPIRKMTPIPPAVAHGKPNIVYLDVTGNTKSVIGNTINTNNTGGYYLVEVLGLGGTRNGYIDTNENNGKMFAIVSKQYDSNNIITGYGDSGINRTIVGQAGIITDCRVRILDPRDKVPADELGVNNTIFLEIIKQGPIQLQLKAEQEAQAAKSAKKQS